MVIWLGRIKEKIITPKITFLQGNWNLASPYPTTEQETTFKTVGTPATIILIPRDFQKSMLAAAWE